MNARNILLSAVVGATLALPVPAMAQAAFSVAEITAACASGNCATTVAAVIARLRLLGLTPAQMNSALGQMAAVLVEFARNNPGTAVDVGASLDLVAAASTDSNQKAAIQQVAQIVASGNADTVVLDDAVAGSPT